MKFFGLAVSLLALAAVVAVTLIARDPSEPDDPGAETAASLDIDYAAALADARGPLAELYAQGDAVIETGDPLGELRDQLDRLKGTPAVVNVWASWCGPCRAEFPVFQRVSADRGTEVAFVGVDSKDPPAGAGETFLEDYPIPYPSIYDEDGEIQVEELGVPSGLPATGFYDASGKRVFVHQGPYLEPEDLEADIDRYLGDGAKSR
ncbi:TlpA family protein disulfide reductase [Thermoleophilia bacterium SCSIO 60948]|nr:TlpA family protein disulfide reductase [Thermoleophilia bacterium SCSIO 60948]